MSKMSIGIITLQGDNYGATLQAVALNKKLNVLGYEAENLNYNDKKRVLSRLSIIGKIKYVLRRKILTPILVGNKRKKGFQRFRAEYLQLSSQKWDTKEALIATPPIYDVYISGSDQIWNPDVIGNDYNYLLAFVKDEDKKIAYASSFGRMSIEESKRELYEWYLSRYDSIGVREESGCILAEKLSGKSCETVLDPTLLLSKEEWLPMASERIESQPYILCYYMPGDEVVCGAIKKIAEELSRKTGKKIVSLGLQEHYKFKREYNFNPTAGPAEFLSLFMYADCVVTNSFHGTAFATNFGKELFVPINCSLDEKNARHVRMTNYLKMIALEEAIVPISEGNYNLRENALDYTYTTPFIIQKREESIKFLINAIEG